jgi:hypothetical protein
LLYAEGHKAYPTKYHSTIFDQKISRKKKHPKKLLERDSFLGGEFVQYFEEKNIVIISSVKQQARQGQQHVTLAIA